MLRTLVAIVLVALGASPASAQWLCPGSLIYAGHLVPGVTIPVVPSWGNCGPTFMCAAGGIQAFYGPSGPAYSVVRSWCDYGCLPGFSPPVPCGPPYEVRIDAATRPVLHWDATMVENVIGSSATWTLHVGKTFVDVPQTSPFYIYVERIVHKDVTGGCTSTAYCPAASVSREQMAAFVLIAKEAAGYTPPACGTPVFGDVPAASPFCRWIEELARRGVASGCGGGNYCPASLVTREQMAVFVLRTLYPFLNPPACGAPIFADVPASGPFCPWIEELARRGVVSGCGGGNYCPAAPVTREQMSVFLSVAFGLTLPGQ